MKKSNLKIKGILWILILALAFQACKKDDEQDPSQPVDHQRSEISKITSLGLYTPDDIKQLLDNSGVDFPFMLKHTVEAISVEYYTFDNMGNLVIASGALFVPQSLSAFPMMSIQHGTETKSDLVASVSPYNSTEGIIGLLTASMDYVTLVPDYPGFGASSKMHPFLHAASIVPSVVDFIRAGQKYCSEHDIILKDELYLTGYSEGGYVSLLTQKSIEESYQNEIELTAVAPLAGPYDLKGMFDTIFQQVSYSTPAYVAYFLTAYNNIYKWNSLHNFFKAPYASMMPGLFDGTSTWAEVVNALPVDLDDLMHPDFITNYYGLKGSDVSAAISDNTLLNWKPINPIHFFHGDGDDVVFCMNATNAMNAFISNGANDVQLTIIAGGDHETSGPTAIRGAIEWFESFRPDQ